MKKKSIVFYLAVGLITVSIFSFQKPTPEEKKYPVLYTEKDWNSRYNWIAVSKQLLERSNVPMDQGKPLIDSLTKFMNELASQLVPQINPLPPAKDSTKKK